MVDRPPTHRAKIDHVSWGAVLSCTIMFWTIGYFEINWVEMEAISKNLFFTKNIVITNIACTDNIKFLVYSFIKFFGCIFFFEFRRYPCHTIFANNCFFGNGINFIFAVSHSIGQMLK